MIVLKKKIVFQSYFIPHFLSCQTEYYRLSNDVKNVFEHI